MKWNRITVGDCLTFPVNQQCVQVLAATNACHLTHGIHLDNKKTFLVINFLHSIHPKVILKEVTDVRHQERQDQFHTR